jgi:hypothetical protein
LEWVKMRVLLAVYLAVAQSVAGAVAVAPPPPNIAEVSTAILAAQLMEGEKASWSALQRRDRGAWLALLSNDYSHVNWDGASIDREGAFYMFADPVIEEYTIHYLRGALVSPNVFVLTYSIARRLDGTVHSAAALFTSCSIWAKRNGTWLKIRYQETPVVLAAR